MDLSLIYRALQGNRQVILPGYGAFLRGDGEVLDLSQLTFTPFLLRSDGELEGQIGLDYGLGSVESAAYAESLSQYVRVQVDQHGECAIPGLGWLRRETNGLVLFYAAEEMSSGEVRIEQSGTVWCDVVEELSPTTRSLSDAAYPEENFLTDSTSIPEELTGDKEDALVSSMDVEQLDTSHLDESIKERYTNCSIPPITAIAGSRKNHRFVFLVILLVLLIAGGVSVWYMGWFRESLLVAWRRIEGVIKDQESPHVGGDVSIVMGKRGTIGASESQLNQETEKKVQQSENSKVDDEDSRLRKGKVITTASARGSNTQVVRQSGEVLRRGIPQADPRLPYHIILGSFESPDYAQHFAERMGKVGFSPVVLRSTAGVNRVALSSFSGKDAALSALFRLRSEYANVWLYEQ